jgi:hypothetical protein
LADYEPSEVVSKSGGHTQLSSSASVGKVTSFYEKALKGGGWNITTSTRTATSSNIVAKRGNQGVTIAVSSAGPAGTSISVSTYPSG